MEGKVKTHTFTYGTTQSGSRNYFVRAEDYSDLNSADTKITVTFVTGGSSSPSTTSSSSSSTTSSTTTTSQQSTETVVSDSTTGTPTIESVQSTLSEAGITDEQAVATAEDTASKMEVTRSLTVEKTSGGGMATTYSSVIETTISNSTDKDWKNIEIIEVVPKSVAMTASKIINANYAFEVVKDDPVLKFTVPEVLAGESVTISYEVKSSLKKAVLQDYSAPAITSVVEQENLCTGVRCAPLTCQTSSCNRNTGQCEYNTASDGTWCEEGKVCKAGECTAEQAPAAGKPAAPAPKQDNSGLIAGIAVIVIVLVAGYLYIRGGKKKTTPSSAIRK